MPPIAKISELQCLIHLRPLLDRAAARSRGHDATGGLLAERRAEADDGDG